MNTTQLLQYIQQQRSAIQALIDQLDEVQVAFNAEFDSYKARHDDALDHLVDQVAGDPDAAGAKLRALIDERLPVELNRIHERREKLEVEYLPQRRQAAAGLLQQAQTELARLRDLNPELDRREESLKEQKALLEADLTRLNENIQRWSRGLGVLRHFMDITRADRERHRTLGKLEATQEALYAVRTEWDKRQGEITGHQAELQERWQLESIAVARLRSELDQLEDVAQRNDLAVRRAIRHVLDSVTEAVPSPDPGLEKALGEMAELNLETDAFHAGLASVGGFIGLARGVSSGLEAISHTIEGLQREQQMHSTYLVPLSFDIPLEVDRFGKVWPDLEERFADETEIRSHPAAFSAAVTPIVDGPLSEESIEAMFAGLGAMIQRATSRW